MRGLVLVGACAALAACRDATAPRLSVAAVALSAPTDVLVVGDSVRITARVSAANGSELAGRTVTWVVTDPSVGAVSTTGVFSARGVGSTFVRASSEGTQAQLTVQVAPASLPLLRPPFAGPRQIWNPFDHSLPHEFQDDDRVFLDWRDERLAGRINGHNGYDWVMPEGTPVLAAADGVVSFAGSEQPWSCPLLGGALVSALYVNLRHTAPGGELFATVYLHLSRIDVRVGDSVRVGQQIGLSGTSGCSSGPHLHFTVVRQRYARNGSTSGVVVDPFGWAGREPDPWLLAPDGAPSTRLWLPGQDPPYQLTAQADAVPLDRSSPEPVAGYGVRISMPLRQAASGVCAPPTLLVVAPPPASGASAGWAPDRQHVALATVRARRTCRPGTIPMPGRCACAV